MLGVIILTSFLVALALSAPLRPRFVRQAPEISQPKRTFMLELGLCLFAGLLVNAYNMIFFAMPLINTSAITVGCAVAGFFIGLDSALAREKHVIQEAMSRDHTLPLPKHLFSMTRKFSFVALITTLFVATVLAMVFARDIVWLSKIGQDDASIAHAQMSVTTEIVFIMAILMVLVVNLIISFSRNLKLLFDNETKVLEQVSQALGEKSLAGSCRSVDEHCAAGIERRSEGFEQTRLYHEVGIGRFHRLLRDVPIVDGLSFHEAPVLFQRNRRGADIAAAK